MGDEWDAKQWNRQFSIDQDAEIRSFWQETKRFIRGEGDELGFLFDDFEESGSWCLAEQIREFCRGEHLEDFESEGTIRKWQGQVAWADERARSGDVRMHKNLSAVALYRLLKAPVCISNCHPKR
jgi:hypothetical protein